MKSWGGCHDRSNSFRRSVQAPAVAVDTSLGGWRVRRVMNWVAVERSAGSDRFGQSSNYGLLNRCTGLYGLTPVPRELIASEYFLFQKFKLLIMDCLPEEFWNTPDDLYPYNSIFSAIKREDFAWCSRQVYDARSGHLLLWSVTSPTKTEVEHHRSSRPAILPQIRLVILPSTFLHLHVHRGFIGLNVGAVSGTVRRSSADRRVCGRVT